MYQRPTIDTGQPVPTLSTTITTPIQPPPIVPTTNTGRVPATPITPTTNTGRVPATPITPTTNTNRVPIVPTINRVPTDRVPVIPTINRVPTNRVPTINRVPTNRVPIIPTINRVPMSTKNQPTAKHVLAQKYENRIQEKLADKNFEIYDTVLRQNILRNIIENEEGFIIHDAGSYGGILSTYQRVDTFFERVWIVGHIMTNTDTRFINEILESLGFNINRESIDVKYYGILIWRTMH